MGVICSSTHLCHFFGEARASHALFLLELGVALLTPAVAPPDVHDDVEMGDGEEEHRREVVPDAPEEIVGDLGALVNRDLLLELPARLGLEVAAAVDELAVHLGLALGLGFVSGFGVSQRKWIECEKIFSFSEKLLIND